MLYVAFDPLKSSKALPMRVYLMKSKEKRCVSKKGEERLCKMVSGPPRLVKMPFDLRRCASGTSAWMGRHGDFDSCE